MATNISFQDLPAPVRQLLANKRFTMEEASRNERYYTCKGMLPAYKQPVFFKVNRSYKETLLQDNHVIWTASLGESLPADAPFGIAEVLESGRLEGYSWFIAPYVKGQPFSIEHEGLTILQPPHPKQYFDRIVSLIRHIETSPLRSLHGIDLRLGGKGRFDKLHLLEEMIDWSRPYTPHLAELLQIVNKNYTQLQIAPAHLDFKDTNLIIDDSGRPIVVDAEWGASRQYRYRDAVEFYNRLYTLTCQPVLAQAFQAAYFKVLRASEKQRFLTAFLCLSAERAIGNFAEIEGTTTGSNKTKRLRYAKKYAEAIISHQIVLDLLSA